MKRHPACVEDQGFLYSGSTSWTRWVNFAFGCPDRFAFEHRFLNAVLMFGTGISILMNVVNHHVGFDHSFLVEMAAYSAGGIGMYLLSRFGKMFQVSRLLMVAATYLLTARGWFLTGGLTSGFPPFMMFFAALIAMVYSGWSRWLAAGLYLAMIPALSYVELSHPHLMGSPITHTLPNQSMLYVDVLVSYCVFSIALTSLTAVLIDAFKRENLKVAARSVQLKKLAETDGLTGLFNRSRVMAILAEQVALSLRYERKLCVLMIDFDHFKSINDTWGHAEGDRVLKTAAAAIEEHCRQTDSVGRFGGEEFLAVIPFTDREGLEKMAERLRTNVSEKTVKPDGTPVTISVGGAIWNPGMTVEDLVAAADRNMYAAKADGRDRVVVMECPGADRPDGQSEKTSD